MRKFQMTTDAKAVDTKTYDINNTDQNSSTENERSTKGIYSTNLTRGANGRVLSYTADTGLHTYVKILKTVFGKNANIDSMKSKQLGDSCDRPHKVVASINPIMDPDKRDGQAFVSWIGNLGDDEMTLRSGKSEARVAEYDGGHLVGYQVLAGPQADRQWNVAPQESNNNRKAYNNTIENMVRLADKGSEISLTVTLKYERDNFEVDQQQLIRVGVLERLDVAAPWIIQMPSRIPSEWSAIAKLDEGKFGSGAALDGEGASEIIKKTRTTDFDAILDENSETHSARYRLAFENKKGEIDPRPIEYADDISAVYFSMRQVVPVDNLTREVDGIEKYPTVNYGPVSRSEEKEFSLAEWKKQISDMKSESRVSGLSSIPQYSSTKDLAGILSNINENPPGGEAESEPLKKNKAPRKKKKIKKPVSEFQMTPVNLFIVSNMDDLKSLLVNHRRRSGLEETRQMLLEEDVKFSRVEGEIGKRSYEKMKSQPEKEKVAQDAALALNVRQALTAKAMMYRSKCADVELDRDVTIEKLAKKRKALNGMRRTDYKILHKKFARIYRGLMKGIEPKPEGPDGFTLEVIKKIKETNLKKSI